MTYSNRDSLASSFSIVPFMSFSCLLAIAKALGTVSNKRGESDHPGLIYDFNQNALKLSPFKIMFAMGVL